MTKALQMKIELFGEALTDEVLGASYWVGKTNYGYAIKELYPLIQRLEIQRGQQNPSFYARLRNDLKLGCIIPPITIAFITKDHEEEIGEEYINSQISNGFVLDGIQRLSAIHRASEEIGDLVDSAVFLDRTLHLNIIISPSMDKLLYRMITLNNGQKPMSPRHQIDILSETIFDFDSLSLKNQAHKERQKSANKLAVHRSDIVKGYIAYLSNTTAIDNKLIIEEKMDELIAERIIGSEFSSDKYEFIDVLRWIANICTENELNTWFISSNNFIGFCVAARRNFDELEKISISDFKDHSTKFETIFSNFDKRKIKVGDYRRKMVSEYFGNLSKYSELLDSEVILELSQA